MLMTPQEEITKLVNEAYAAINAAENIADEHGLEFDFDLAYGMGGRYYGHMTKDFALKLLESGKELTEAQREAIQSAIDEDVSPEDTGWFASSQG